MTALEHGYVSSSLVKEIASFDGDVSSMIPAAALGPVHKALAARG
jgi:phosphopantetheine adenylyltransferase